MTESEGRLVAGRYRLRRALGQGGMGVVWLAYDEYLHREVAVKEIQPRGREIRETDPEVRRALREARAAAKLSKHPGIVTVHDVVTGEDELPWIVMEVLHGRSLRAALDTDGPMPVDQAARIGAQVLAALDYAHGQGVLHRDVKPGNVVLVSGDDGDQAVLTDFGIAVLDGVSVLTATGQLPGSPEYVAPERIRGEEALPAADLWSVGVMLYGMVVGRTPFQRGDVQATMGAALSLHPDPDPRVGRLAPVIEGLLRKRPAERMTAKQAIASLTQIAAEPAAAWPRGDQPRGEENTAVDTTLPDVNLTALPVASRPPSNTRVAPDAPTLDPGPAHRPSPPRPPRSKRGPVVAAGAVLVVVAVVVTIVLVNRGDHSAAPKQHPTTTTTTTTFPLENHREPLGFEIDVPEDWERRSTADGPVTHVIWTGRQVDPKVGPLEVRVTRDTTAAGEPAIAYLTDLDRAKSTNPDNIGYDQLSLTGRGATSDLEYTYQAANGGMYFHERVRAEAPGDVYTLTFSMFASDPTTLGNQWRAAGPLMAEIRESFRLTP